MNTPTTTLKALAVIPARYASTRFPGKPLARDTGKYLIQHVVEQTRKAQHVGEVIVATDDARIVQAVESFGGKVVMTGNHPNGTSRIAEVVMEEERSGRVVEWSSGRVKEKESGPVKEDEKSGQVDKWSSGRVKEEESGRTHELESNAVSANSKFEIRNSKSSFSSDLILNIQGDEPEIDPTVIDALAEAMLADPQAPMGTVASPFATDEDSTNPNIVKVVCDQRGRALYFSRSLIPHDRDRSGRCLPLKHIGLYAYRRDFLLKYVTLPMTPLEQCEQLEQLRALEQGYPIAVVQRTVHHHGIDTPQQYAAFVARCRK